MTYLRQVRLGRAHLDLRIADPARGSVADIAGRWGFTHLGRFAATYRERYGCPPSQTLRSSARPSAHSGSTVTGTTPTVTR